LIVFVLQLALQAQAADKTQAADLAFLEYLGRLESADSNWTEVAQAEDSAKAPLSAEQKTVTQQQTATEPKVPPKADAQR